MKSDRVFDLMTAILMFPTNALEHSAHRSIRLLGMILYIPWALVFILPIGLPLMLLCVALSVWEETAPMTRPSDADLAEMLYREAERYHVAVGREGHMGNIPRLVCERRRDKLNDAADALAVSSREHSDGEK